MELWQLDTVHGFALADGTAAKALTGIDDHSRFCVSARLMLRERTQAVCDGFSSAMSEYWVPAQVLTDNGKVFTGRFAQPPVEVLFDRICRENGVDHILTEPRSPTTTGKIERFHGTLRRELLTGREFPTLAIAQRAIDDWITEYNTDRPHQSLGGCTPAERFATRSPDAGPALDLRAIAERRRGDDWISRRVASNGVISVSWQQFSVGKHHSGELVDVHVTDRLLEVWSGNDLIKTLVRTSGGGEIRKKRAERTARSPVLRRQASPETNWSTIS